MRLPALETSVSIAGGSLGTECLPRNFGIVFNDRVVERNVCVEAPCAHCEFVLSCFLLLLM